MADIPVKVVEDETTKVRLAKVLDHIANGILDMELKKGQQLMEWLRLKVDLIAKESVTPPGFYERGQIVHVDFGFNVGSEEGGQRFAVVLWAEANAKTITVVPITSLKPDKADRMLSLPYHVNLDHWIDDENISIVKVQQIRAVSKLRVRPILYGRRYKTDRVSPEHLDLIDQVIVSLYTSCAQGTRSGTEG